MGSSFKTWRLSSWRTTWRLWLIDRLRQIATFPNSKSRYFEGSCRIICTSSLTVLNGFTQKKLLIETWSHKMSCSPKLAPSRYVTLEAVKWSIRRAKILLILSPDIIELLNLSSASPNMGFKSIFGLLAVSWQNSSFRLPCLEVNRKEISCSKYNRSWGQCHHCNSNNTKLWCPSTARS